MLCRMVLMPKKKKTGKVPVYLNVYDLTPINGYAYWLGLGVYHSGVQGKLLFRCCGFRSASTPSNPILVSLLSFSFSLSNQNVIFGSENLGFGRITELLCFDFSCLACAKNRKKKERKDCKHVLQLFAGDFYYNSFINKADIMSIVGREIDLCNKVLDLVSHTCLVSVCFTCNCVYSISTWR